MVITKVTREFIEQNKQIKKRALIAERNRLSALGILSHQKEI